jgi:hypothetical protein
MLPKKHLSGSEKRKKRKRTEALIKSQQGALEKFVFKIVDTQENLVNSSNENLNSQMKIWLMKMLKLMITQLFLMMCLM